VDGLTIPAARTCAQPDVRSNKTVVAVLNLLQLNQRNLAFMHEIFLGDQQGPVISSSIFPCCAGPLKSIEAQAHAGRRVSHDTEADSRLIFSNLNAG
jgi:hypothetical protein